MEEKDNKNNSGDRNSGNSNSGNSNSGNSNSGYFNIGEPKIRIFGKETEVDRNDIDFPGYLYFKITKWVKYEDMSDKEKEENPNAKYIKGYLKTYEYKEAFRNSFESAEIEDIRKTLDLPNFDYEIFEKISGISKADFDRRLNNNTEIKTIQ